MRNHHLKTRSNPSPYSCGEVVAVISLPNNELTIQIFQSIIDLLVRVFTLDCLDSKKLQAGAGQCEIEKDATKELLTHSNHDEAVNSEQ
jgi:hypothetical protein